LEVPFVPIINLLLFPKIKFALYLKAQDESFDNLILKRFFKGSVYHFPRQRITIVIILRNDGMEEWLKW
jgi:hypothetical protein